MQEQQQVVTDHEPNGNPTAMSEVQTFNIRGEIELNGSSTPATITISVQDEIVRSVTAQSESRIFTGELSLRLKSIPTSSEEGEECQCCTSGPNGMVCRVCPC